MIGEQRDWPPRCEEPSFIFLSLHRNLYGADHTGSYGYGHFELLMLATVHRIINTSRCSQMSIVGETIARTHFSTLDTYRVSY